MRNKLESQTPPTEQRPTPDINQLLVHWESRQVISALTLSAVAVAKWAHGQYQSYEMRAKLADQALNVTDLLLNQKILQQLKSLIQFCNEFLIVVGTIDLSNALEVATVFETTMIGFRSFPFALSFAIGDGFGSEEEFLQITQLMGQYTDLCYEAITLIDQLDMRSINMGVRARYVGLKRQLIGLLGSGNTNQDTLITHTIIEVVELADQLIPGFRTSTHTTLSIQA
jgi:hypothetical protein